MEIDAMIRTVLAMTAIAVGVTAVMAQSDPIAQRKALMKDNGKNSATLNRMVRGEEPFDASKVTAAYAGMADIAAKVGPLFASPPPAGADTRALPKIWETKADFDAKMDAFSKAVADGKGKSGTLDELKVSYQVVNKTCGDCHEPYRRPAPPGGGKK
jgi:cytochrome c556